MDDRQLHEAIQAGAAGWERLVFERFQRLVRGLLIKTLGPQAEVEDLVGEVFVGLLESAINIRTPEGMQSYVVSVTMNTARREIRRQKRRRFLFWRQDSHDALERAPGLDDPKAKAALLQLHRILEELGTEERLVYVLHELDGLTLLQVAEALGLSHSTVKRRLVKANDFVLRRARRHVLLADYIHDKARSTT